MLISSPRIKSNINVNICNLERKDHLKYLGVYLDQHVTWDMQIKHIDNKLSKNIGIIYKLLYHLDLKTLQQIYYALVYPYLSYAIMSWGNSYKSKLTITKI